jgi:antirestriction protein ArdC
MPFGVYLEHFVMSNTVNWSALLSDAVNKPGIISQAYSAFHAYSVGNQMLAYSQCLGREIPIGPIATFKRWQALGRNVKKGSKAIQLCMPVTINKKDAQGEKTGECFQAFVLKNNWFVLDQTEGADYAHDAPSPEWDAAQALPALDVTQVAFEHPDGNCQGFAQGRCIAVNPVAALPHKTRFHELAHVILGHTSEGQLSDSERTPRDIREVEAESVAYICCSILGLPGLDECRGYIQAWLKGESISDKTAQRIFGAAEKILKAGRKPIAVAENA